ncbi:MAG: 23S rRNA (adenine(2503)-C(2))-methyltransferase RlmN [Candidatus Omnitrophica bacterium]|nr:23S rRNA (adenine(2503)-C(2))-methyltransferase RlmN [Candidatus Omnitrophota bacterium]
MRYLYDLTPQEIETIVASYKLPKYRGVQILEGIYKKHALSWDEIPSLSKEIRKKLSSTHEVASLRFVEARDARGDSQKFLFQTADEHFLESVLIAQKERETVCVSTQLGCKIKCVFCASGKGPFVRNLTAGEIVEQVAWIGRRSGKKITNVVFMGMGEPLDNFEAAVKAVRILTAPWGFGLGARRVTVSTAGITPRILEFVQRVDGRVRLSVSLHSSREDVRSALVPINRRYPLQGLVAALQRINRDLKREITFEYTIIAGVNDSEEEARGVVAIAKPLKAKINVIPYNPVSEFGHRPPDEETLRRFCKTLEKGGLRVMLRRTAGQEIDAACGQLRLDRLSQ